MIWYYQNRFISPGFHLLHIQRQRKNDFNDVLCKKGFVVYYKFVYVFLLLTYTFCSTNIILGVDTLKWKIFFMLFSSEIDFHNLICIFNQARLCLRDIWITIFDDFLLLMSTIVTTERGLKRVVFVYGWRRTKNEIQ